MPRIFMLTLALLACGSPDPPTPMANGEEQEPAAGDEIHANLKSQVPSTSESTPGSSLPHGDAAVARELAELRRKVGEDLFRGTLLESSPEASEAEFLRGVRRAMSAPQPVKDAPAVAAEGSNQSVVRTLRDHGEKLERIANQLEEMRVYDAADALRETAQQLRLVARQFDGRRPRKSSGKGQ